MLKVELFDLLFFILNKFNVRYNFDVTSVTSVRTKIELFDELVAIFHALSTSTSTSRKDIEFDVFAQSKVESFGVFLLRPVCV